MVIHGQQCLVLVDAGREFIEPRKLQWLYTASNAWYTHLFVHEKRGEAALRSEASVLKAFCGYAVHDGLASSFKVSEGRLVLCHAHRVRAVQGWIEPGSQWATEMQTFLLDR